MEEQDLQWFHLANLVELVRLLPQDLNQVSKASLKVG